MPITSFPLLTVVANLLVGGLQAAGRHPEMPFDLPFCRPPLQLPIQGENDAASDDLLFLCIHVGPASVTYPSNHWVALAALVCVRPDFSKRFAFGFG
jgi:hypothetical protein